MASVTLDRFWIHDAADLGTYLTFYTSDRSDSRSIEGAVRQYAGGRRRTITRLGSRKELPVTLRLANDEELAQLEGWLGDLVLVRDHRGRLMFASFLSLDVSDHTDRSGYDVSVTFSEVTSSIEV